MSHPRHMFGIVLLSVVVALISFIRLRVDTDPENMLPADEPVRVLH